MDGLDTRLNSLAVKAAILTVAAQAISSLTNFTVNALAFETSELAEFGRFSVVVQLCLVIISTGHGGIGNATLIHGSVPDDDKQEEMGSAAATTSLVFGAVMAVPLLVASLFVGDQMSTLLMFAAFGAPALISQYIYRTQLFAIRDTRRVVLIDTIWLAVVAVTAVANWIFALGFGAKEFLITWLIGAAISAAPFIRQGLRSPLVHLRRFWEMTGPQALRTGAEGMMARSIFVVSLVGVQAVLGDDDAGSLAAAALVFSPLSVVNSAIPSFVVPNQIGRRGIHIVGRTVPLAVIAVAAGATVMWAFVVVGVQNLGIPLGPFDLSAGGVGAALFIATLIRFVAMGVWQGPLAALRIADAAQSSFRVRAVATAVQWVAPIATLLLFPDLDLAAFALGLATLFGAGFAWRTYRNLTEADIGVKRAVTRTNTPPVSG